MTMPEFAVRHRFNSSSHTPERIAAADLTAEQRQILTLALTKDYREIATDLGIAIGTVKSRINRARRRIEGYPPW